MKCRLRFIRALEYVFTSTCGVCWWDSSCSWSLAHILELLWSQALARADTPVALSEICTLWDNLPFPGFMQFILCLEDQSTEFFFYDDCSHCRRESEKETSSAVHFSRWKHCSVCKRCVFDMKLKETYLNTLKKKYMVSRSH